MLAFSCMSSWNSDKEGSNATNDSADDCRNAATTWWAIPSAESAAGRRLVEKEVMVKTMRVNRLLVFFIIGGINLEITRMKEHHRPTIKK
jgi:hypothetical protein